MKLTNLITENRAVSPVIAIVLMIAVTVILATVVASLAFSLGGGAKPTPQVNLDFEWDDGGTVGGADDELVITHVGGDSLDPAQVEVLVDGAVAPIGSWGADPVVTGTSYTIDESGTDVANEGDEVRVVWRGDEGQGATLGVYVIPS